MLGPGEVLHDEWLAMVYGTRYRLLHMPFVAPILTADGKRGAHDAFTRRGKELGIVTPNVLSDGPPLPVEPAGEMIRTSRHGADDADGVEVAVWRVENGRECDYLAN